MNPSPTIAGTINSYSYDNDGNLDVTLDIFNEFDLTHKLYTTTILKNGFLVNVDKVLN